MSRFNSIVKVEAPLRTNSLIVLADARLSGVLSGSMASTGGDQQGLVTRLQLVICLAIAGL